MGNWPHIYHTILLADSLPYEFDALCLHGSINVSFQDRKQGEVPLIDETSWESRHKGGMDLHHHATEFDIEFWPVEHPIEPQDEDQPVKCPMPASYSINVRYNVLIFAAEFYTCAIASISLIGTIQLPEEV